MCARLQWMLYKWKISYMKCNEKLRFQSVTVEICGSEIPELACSTTDSIMKNNPEFFKTWIRNSRLLHHSTIYCKHCDVPLTNIALRTYWLDNRPTAKRRSRPGHRPQALKLQKYLPVPGYRAMVPGMSEIPGLKIFREKPKYLAVPGYCEIASYAVQSQYLIVNFSFHT